MKNKVMLAVLASVFVSASCFAQVVGFSATGQGWVISNGSQNGSDPTNNFYTGWFNPSQLEYRSWFEFEPVFNGTIASARLLLPAYEYESPNATESYTVTSRPASTDFADLGTGNFYGSRVYSEADVNMLTVLELSATAIADIQSGQTFRVGGRLTSIQQLDPEEAIFWGSGGQSAQLELTLGSPATEPVPVMGLPGQALMVLLVLAMGGLAVRRFTA